MKFEIHVPAGALLTVSYIGYKNEEVTVKKHVPLRIVLDEDTQKLDEVVVVGYGVQQKRDVTGSIATVKGDDLKNLPVAQMTGALQGLAAGLDIVSDGGSPGAEPAV